ncbi:hypothetical protein NW762_011958 [Fusarium torreyae]|uniref:Uncharacterized protein n=1 Tax=Fusarium torreyae TaxID=1237075 RepID=A0A9W8RRZ5_9HYPO|nr:hypothetical protein NW762_011958 [Fusarium torreyae]
MQLKNLYALTLFASSAFAADCFGNVQSGISKWGDAYWDARQKMCSNSDCGYQQGCTTSGSKTLQGIAKITVNVALSRKNTGNHKGFKDCWDATENIINQCVNSEQKLSGTWEYNGQLYQFNGWYS